MLDINKIISAYIDLWIDAISSIFLYLTWVGNAIIYVPALTLWLLGQSTGIFFTTILIKMFNSLSFIPSRAVDFLDVIPLTIQIWYWTVLYILMYLCTLMTLEEIRDGIKQNIYKNLETILTTLAILPFSEPRQLIIHRKLSGLTQIFRKDRLPYPVFLVPKVAGVEFDKK